MSKEVKDADRGPHELWCDTQNMISERCNCMASSYIDQIEDHLAATQELHEQLAELRAEVERTKGFETALKDAVIRYRETVARQAKVIEKLISEFKAADQLLMGQVITESLLRQSMEKVREAIELAAIENGKAKS